jgi:hypothetical protein
MNYLLCAHRLVRGGGAPASQGMTNPITGAPLAYGGPGIDNRGRAMDFRARHVRGRFQGDIDSCGAVARTAQNQRKRGPAAGTGLFDSFLCS